MGSEPRDPEESEADTNDDPEEEADTAHLDGAADGCGCTEMWEHLAEQRGE